MVDSNATERVEPEFLLRRSRNSLLRETSIGTILATSTDQTCQSRSQTLRSVPHLLARPISTSLALLLVSFTSLPLLSSPKIDFYPRYTQSLTSTRRVRSSVA